MAVQTQLATAALSHTDNGPSRQGKAQGRSGAKTMTEEDIWHFLKRSGFLLPKTSWTRLTDCGSFRLDLSRLLAEKMTTIVIEPMLTITATIAERQTHGVVGSSPARLGIEPVEPPDETATETAKNDSDVEEICPDRGQLVALSDSHQHQEQPPQPLMPAFSVFPPSKTVVDRFFTQDFRNTRKTRTNFPGDATSWHRRPSPLRRELMQELRDLHRELDDVLDQVRRGRQLEPEWSRGTTDGLDPFPDETEREYIDRVNMRLRQKW